MLEKEEADIAFPVTDAFIVARASGRPLTLIGTYVESPLLWGVFTSPHNTSVSNLVELMVLCQREGRLLKVGISRLGSGSQTMAYYASMLHNLGRSFTLFCLYSNKLYYHPFNCLLRRD